MLYYFARPGLALYFRKDDIMNLRRAFGDGTARLLLDSVTFSPDAYRPLGLLWYKAVFALAGLHPHPFAWISFAFVALNLVLLAILSKQLSGSNEITAFAVLLASFHSRLDVLYFAANTIYDILCYTFYFSAAIYYIHVRRTRGRLGISQTILFLFLQGIALDFKEMAVTLPLILLCYELLEKPPVRSRVISRYAPLIASLLMSAVFALRKLGQSNVLTGAYHPQYTSSRFFENWRGYLGELFYQKHPVATWVVVAVWLALLALAFITNSRVLKLCFCIIMIAPLPACFVEPRGLYVIYLSMPGWAIYFATLLAMARQRAHRFLPGAYPAYALVFILLFFMHRSDRPYRFSPGEDQLIRQFTNTFTHLHPRLSGHEKILLVDDPFDPLAWTPSSILELYYRKADMAVLRTKVPDQRAASRNMKFDITVAYRNGQFVDILLCSLAFHQLQANVIWRLNKSGSKFAA